MDNQKITLLANKFINGTANDNEKEELHKWYDEWQDEEEQITHQDENIESARLKILNKIIEKIDRGSIPFTPVVVMKKYGRRRIATAAAIIIILLGGSYILRDRSFDKNEIVKNPTPLKDIAAPKVTKATITLSNGQTVLLDNTNPGLLATQGNVNVTKTADGQIVYTGATSESAYNTLTNPRGSTVINLTLSDGTKVWLNSESSLKYPVAFTGNERKVEITGEAYFEVSKDTHKKFLVDASGVITEVLGTHFNVNSYSDEASTKITLLEGSVKVIKGTATGLLNPGQQAQVNAGVNVTDAVDVNAAIAWKNGLFQFANADLKTVMRQLARWYDLEVSFEGNLSQRKFEGKIQRELNLTDVLDALSKNQVHYKIEGKKLVVFQ